MHDDYFCEGKWMYDDTRKRTSIRNGSNDERSPEEIPEENSEINKPSVNNINSKGSFSDLKLQNPFEMKESMAIKPKGKYSFEDNQEFVDSSVKSNKKPKFQFLKKKPKNIENKSKKKQEIEKNDQENNEKNDENLEKIVNENEDEKKEDYCEENGENNSKFDYLKRKSKKIPTNKVNWTGVRSRIDCWVAKNMTSPQLQPNPRSQSKGKRNDELKTRKETTGSRSRGF